MSTKFQLYIRNTDTGPFKIPFKKDTPKEIQVKVDGVIKVGKKAIIPSDVAEFVDLEILKAAKGRITYKMKTVKEIPSKAKKDKKVVKPKPKVTPELFKEPKKTDFKKEDDKDDSSNKKKGGK